MKLYRVHYYDRPPIMHSLVVRCSSPQEAMALVAMMAPPEDPPGKKLPKFVRRVIEANPFNVHRLLPNGEVATIPPICDECDVVFRRDVSGHGTWACPVCGLETFRAFLSSLSQERASRVNSNSMRFFQWKMRERSVTHQ